MTILSRPVRRPLLGPQPLGGRRAARPPPAVTRRTAQTAHHRETPPDTGARTPRLR
ncbi:hypothetical protein [Streptomyces sp. RKND-216]|uniref:hypothetical protein n=1 Tax=Streptomyces sp. RKND-216 TaxID=2562581 RepID=UPI001446E751|nr:hypothetical protein [Streptomyces sp. RKND-216]